MPLFSVLPVLQSIQRWRFLWSTVLLVSITCLSLGVGSLPAHAAAVDAYVRRYLDAAEPVPMKLDEQGNTQLFSADALSKGKQLFEESCKNCHVGGATLPNPPVSLSLDALQGAMPPRDSINSLVAFFRQPMTYDGSEDTFLCREVPESWMSQEQAETMAAFILRAAEKAPGWGTSRF